MAPPCDDGNVDLSGVREAGRGDELRNQVDADQEEDEMTGWDWVDRVALALFWFVLGAVAGMVIWGAL